MTLPVISGADHRIGYYPRKPCPFRPWQVHQIVCGIEAFSFDALGLVSARDEAFLIANHRLIDNPVGDATVRADHLLAERPKDLDRRQLSATALNRRGRAIAVALRRMGYEL